MELNPTLPQQSTNNTTSSEQQGSSTSPAASATTITTTNGNLPNGVDTSNTNSITSGVTNLSIHETSSSPGTSVASAAVATTVAPIHVSSRQRSSHRSTSHSHRSSNHPISATDVSATANTMLHQAQLRKQAASPSVPPSVTVAAAATSSSTGHPNRASNNSSNNRSVVAPHGPASPSARTVTMAGASAAAASSAQPCNQAPQMAGFERRGANLMEPVRQPQPILQPSAAIVAASRNASEAPGYDTNIIHNPSRTNGHATAAPSVMAYEDDIEQSSSMMGWTVVETLTGAAGGVPPCPRSLHSASVLNGVMYVFGGYDGQARVNDFHAFSFSEQRWSPVIPDATTGPPPSPRDRHISIVYGNTFYVFGGFDGRSRVSDFFGFNTNSTTWREVVHTTAGGSPPSPRHSHSAVVYNHSMFVFGGYDGSYRSDLNEFDFSTSAWNVVPASGRPPRARYRATCVVHKHTMLLFGGHDGTRHLADTHLFDFETRSWSGLIIDGPPPIPRDSHVSAIHGNSMYVFGGSTGSAMNDLHELKRSSDSSIAKWSPIVRPSDLTTPSHRFCHVAVVYRDSMFVFGGYDGSNRLNDFIRFDFRVDEIKCEIPPTSLISDLKLFVNNEELSDITFVVEGQYIYAHKFMLVRSSYFRAMLMGEMREASESIIRLEQIRYPIFISLLEYLYTDEVEIPLESAMELFVAADEFCVPRLKAMCEKRMITSVTVDNAAAIFLAADLHSAESLKSKTLSFILSHFESVSKTLTFEEMARSNVELVFEILRQR